MWAEIFKDDFHLSPSFKVKEFIKTKTGLQNDFRIIEPDYKADIVATHLLLLCREVLQPARNELGCPIIITSGYRSGAVNKKVGGAYFSQHRYGAAADITCRQDKFQKLVELLRNNKNVDQLLTGKGWLHVSTAYTPRNIIKINYYNY